MAQFRSLPRECRSWCDVTIALVNHGHNTTKVAGELLDAGKLQFVRFELRVGPVPDTQLSLRLIPADHGRLLHRLEDLFGGTSTFRCISGGPAFGIPNLGVHELTARAGRGSIHCIPERRHRPDRSGAADVVPRRRCLRHESLHAVDRDRWTIRSTWPPPAGWNSIPRLNHPMPRILGQAARLKVSTTYFSVRAGASYDASTVTVTNAGIDINIQFQHVTTIPVAPLETGSALWRGRPPILPEGIVPSALQTAYNNNNNQTRSGSRVRQIEIRKLLCSPDGIDATGNRWNGDCRWHFGNPELACEHRQVVAGRSKSVVRRRLFPLLRHRGERWLEQFLYLQ